MWRYRITRLLSRKYPELVITDALAAEGSSKRDWNRFLDTHYRRGWNVNVSRVMDNATHVAVYLGSVWETKILYGKPFLNSLTYCYRGELLRYTPLSGDSTLMRQLKYDRQLKRDSC